MGTFTISNLGMYGVTNFSAIIYPQQVSWTRKAMLPFPSLSVPVGGISNRWCGNEDCSCAGLSERVCLSCRVVLAETFFSRLDSFRQTSVLNVTLACDHRVIDGAVGAQWLQEFKQFLENPGSMIL